MPIIRTTHGTTLLHTEAHYDTLQHTATHSNTPQHAAPHSNTKLYCITLECTGSNPPPLLHSPSNPLSPPFQSLSSIPPHSWPLLSQIPPDRCTWLGRTGVTHGTHANELFHACEWAMAHMLSHGKHVNRSWQICEGVDQRHMTWTNTSTNTATHYNTLEHTIILCPTLPDTMQHDAPHCTTLHHTTPHCSTLQLCATIVWCRERVSSIRAFCCNMLQWV